jgi:hypothetical protein
MSLTGVVVADKALSDTFTGVVVADKALSDTFTGVVVADKALSDTFTGVVATDNTFRMGCQKSDMLKKYSFKKFSRTEMPEGQAPPQVEK